MKNYDITSVRVLVVEASPMMQGLLKNLLKELKVKEVQIMSSGHEALSQMRLYDPDLLIVDWLTDDMPGIELVRQIRTAKNSKNPFLSIIMMSGLSSYKSIVTARDSGINEFLAKPISPKSLYEKICHVIERPRRYIRCEKYFGPDRRRKQIKHYGYKDRRSASEKGGGAAA